MGHCLEQQRGGADQAQGQLYSWAAAGSGPLGLSPSSGPLQTWSLSSGSAWSAVMFYYTV